MTSLRYPALLIALFAFLAAPSAAQAQDPPARLAPSGKGPSPFLASTSPFLVRAGEQPVVWRPWEGAAFREARRLDRLVFLWIGASWCHWCHEMGRGAFQDPRLAALLNEGFVPVVVDRDLRPDIDRRYQRVVLSLSGRGGWPLVAVLTPAGDVVFGGGFYTAGGERGHPGLVDILTELNERWGTEKEAVIAAAQQATWRALETEATLSGHRRPQPSPGEEAQAEEPTPIPALVASQVVDRVVGGMLAGYDPLHGGFGQAPRFPHAATLDLLLTYAESTGQTEVLDRALHTLNVMASGAVRDPISGLFFRYSADDAWQHPGFEVLLPTNVELLQVYLHAYQLTGRARYREVAEGILEGLMAHMALPGGGFAASLAGEGPRGEEGGYYTFTAAELRAILSPEELEVAQARLGMDGPGPLADRPNAYIPLAARSIPEVARLVGKPVPETEAILSTALDRLERARSQRHQVRDDTLIVAWNARAASALFEASRVLGREDALAEALKTMEMIIGGADPERSELPHVLPPSPWAGMDLSSTRIATSLGLLDAFEATGDAAWLVQAQRIVDGTLEQYWDPETGGFFDTPENQSRNPLSASRWKDVVDGLLPSTNGLGMTALQRLSLWTGDPRYAALANQALTTFEPMADALGLLGATWARAALGEADPAPVVIVASLPGGDAGPLEEAAGGTFRPGTAVVRLSAQDLEGLAAYDLHAPAPAAPVAGVAPPSPLAFAWVCSTEGCSEALTSPQRLSEAIRAHGRRGLSPVGAPTVRAPLP